MAELEKVEPKIKKTKKHGGKREGSGRKAGTPNKLTTDVKLAILKAFDEVGGVEWLVNLARSDAKAFVTLLGKTVPVGVAGDPENPLRLAVTIDRPAEETREQWLARRHRELGIGPETLGAAARPANGRDHS